jgi:hypothetical protein
LRAFPPVGQNWKLISDKKMVKGLAEQPLRREKKPYQSARTPEMKRRDDFWK